MTLWNQQDRSNHIKCICPPGFSGPLCNSQSEECGSGACYHGGTCVETVVEHADQTGLISSLKAQFNCDCTTARTNNVHAFSGEFCQFPATKFCSDTDPNFFCVNNGTCKDDPTLGCECPRGYGGHKCEIKLNGVSQSDAQSDAQSDDPVDAPTDQGDGTSSLHAGEQCGGVYCRNGGKCFRHPIVNEDGSQGVDFHCNCNHAFDDETIFAGSTCQYSATQFHHIHAPVLMGGRETTVKFRQKTTKTSRILSVATPFATMVEFATLPKFFKMMDPPGWKSIATALQHSTTNTNMQGNRANSSLQISVRILLNRNLWQTHFFVPTMANAEMIQEQDVTALTDFLATVVNTKRRNKSMMRISTILLMIGRRILRYVVTPFAILEVHALKMKKFITMGKS